MVGFYCMFFILVNRLHFDDFGMSSHFLLPTRHYKYCVCLCCPSFNNIAFNSSRQLTLLGLNAKHSDSWSWQYKLSWSFIFPTVVINAETGISFKDMYYRSQTATWRVFEQSFGAHPVWISPMAFTSNFLISPLSQIYNLIP